MDDSVHPFCLGVFVYRQGLDRSVLLGRQATHMMSSGREQRAVHVSPVHAVCAACCLCVRGHLHAVAQPPTAASHVCSVGTALPQSRACTATTLSVWDCCITCCWCPLPNSCRPLCVSVHLLLAWLLPPRLFGI